MDPESTEARFINAHVPATGVMARTMNESDSHAVVGVPSLGCVPQPASPTTRLRNQHGPLEFSPFLSMHATLWDPGGT
jgi:hypothetical protein